MNSSIEIANEFVKLSLKNNKSLSPLKLLKLVYLSHGWMLSLKNKPMFTCDIEMWKYGPIIPALYKTIEKYRDCHIDKPLINNNLQLMDDKKQIIQDTLEIYGNISAIKLSVLTNKIRNYYKFVNGEKISNDIIQDYFKRVLSNIK